MSATLTAASVVARADSTIAAPLGDELMMMSVERGSYFGMNDIGARVWEHLSAPIAVEGLCAALQDEFDVEPDRCRADVLAFLGELCDAGLARVVG